MVSHGHGAQVEQLLRAVNRWADARLKKVIITVNAPTLDAGFFRYQVRDFPFALSVIQNSQPRGFGANHNRAFQQREGDSFFVMNPDLELPENPFPALLTALSNNTTGCAYPIQISPGGERQDFERMLPTPAAILKRRLSPASDVLPTSAYAQWISGSFMAFDSAAYRSIAGFDERYFMYCEDVDVCLRLQLAGYRLARADTTVIHHAQRQSLKNFRHLAWHVRSLLRLWNSGSYKAFRLKYP